MHLRFLQRHRRDGGGGQQPLQPGRAGSGESSLPGLGQPDQLARSAMEGVWTLHDAKNRFSAVVEAALQGKPQKVTRRGAWASVVLPAAE